MLKKAMCLGFRLREMIIKTLSSGKVSLKLYVLDIPRVVPTRENERS